MTMQHTDVDRTLAVERYLLGEMSATEIEDFEEHIFTCRQCAEELRNGTVFCDGARAVFRGEARRQPQPEPEPRRRSWNRLMLPMLAPAFATLLLLCLAGYERLVVIPGLQQQLAQATAPKEIAAFALPGLSRGEEPELKAPPAAPFEVYFDVATPSPSGYSCEFRDASGAVRLTVSAAAAPGATVYLLLGSSQLPAGEYTLVVRTKGPDSTEVGQHPFKLKYQ
jgi:hypothetical protein